MRAGGSPQRLKRPSCPWVVGGGSGSEVGGQLFVFFQKCERPIAMRTLATVGVLLAVEQLEPGRPLALWAMC